MAFYLFQLDKLVCNRQRGNIADQDVVTFNLFINNSDYGHGAGRFTLTTNTIATTQARTVDGLLSNPAGDRFNMSMNWQVGPVEIRDADEVSVIYTGTNTSDESLTSIATKERDDLEIKILNYVAKKYVELIAGLEFTSDIASAFSEAFDKAFKNPIGDLVGYRPVGPCNGPVFADALQFTGESFADLSFGPFPVSNSRPPQPTNSSSVSFVHFYTDEATHDTNICGGIAETDVTFLVRKVSFVSLRWLLPERFPSLDPGLGLRQYTRRAATSSLKAVLGVRF